MNSYTVVQYTHGTCTYTVEAETEEEALALVQLGKVDYDSHEWEDDGEPFIDE